MEETHPSHPLAIYEMFWAQFIVQFFFRCSFTEAYLEPNRTSTMNFKWLQLESNSEPLSSWTKTQSFGQTDQMVESVWPNGWVFVYELSGSEFESSCSHLNSDYAPVSSKEFHYRVWIHSETRTWHDKNIQYTMKFFFAKTVNGFHWPFAHIPKIFISFAAVSMAFLKTENMDLSSANSLDEQVSSEGRCFL